MENVQLFILCTQFVNVSSVFNKQGALPREGCPFIPTAWASCCGPRGYLGGGGIGAPPGHGYFLPAMPEDKVQVGISPPKPG